MDDIYSVDARYPRDMGGEFVIHHVAWMVDHNEELFESQYDTYEEAREAVRSAQEAGANYEFRIYSLVLRTGKSWYNTIEPMTETEIL